jgi:hypothetical protein
MISRPSLQAIGLVLKDEMNVFMASFGLWTHKDQVNQSLVYEINGLGFISFCHVTYHLVGLFYNMLPWFDSSVNKYL